MTTATSSLSAPGPAPVVPRTGPWLVGGAGAMALLVVAGWFSVISPQRSAMSDTEDSIVQAQSNVDLLTTRVAQLKQQYASLPELQAELTSLEQQLPGDAALPELVRALRDAAASTGAELTELTPAAPQAFGAGAGGDAAAAPAASAGAAAATSATGSGDAATGAATGTAAAAAAPAAAAPSAAGGGAQGLLQVPVTITATGSYASLQNFLAAVQRQPRLVLVSGTSFAPGGGQGASDLTLSITGFVFSLPGAGGAAVPATGAASTPATAPAVAAAVAPAADATSTPTSTPTSDPTDAG